MSNIISITDIIEQKVRKQRELDDYEVRLDDLKRKKYWVEKEIRWQNLSLPLFNMKSHLNHLSRLLLRRS